jgi:hypothetical protein
MPASDFGTRDFGFRRRSGFRLGRFEGLELAAELIVFFTKAGKVFGLFPEAPQFLIVPAKAGKLLVFRAESLQFLIGRAQLLQLLFQLGGGG